MVISYLITSECVRHKWVMLLCKGLHSLAFHWNFCDPSFSTLLSFHLFSYSSIILPRFAKYIFQLFHNDRCNDLYISIYIDRNLSLAFKRMIWGKKAISYLASSQFFLFFFIQTPFVLHWSESEFLLGFTTLLREVRLWLLKHETTV